VASSPHAGPLPHTGEGCKTGSEELGLNLRDPVGQGEDHKSHGLPLASLEESPVELGDLPAKATGRLATSAWARGCCHRRAHLPGWVSGAALVSAVPERASPVLGRGVLGDVG